MLSKKRPVNVDHSPEHQFSRALSGRAAERHFDMAPASLWSRFLANAVDIFLFGLIAKAISVCCSECTMMQLLTGS